MKALLVLASCALLASPALAQPAGDNGGNSPAPSADSQDNTESGGASNQRTPASTRRICRQIESDTGSRMGTRRVCRTEAQWRSEQRVN